MFAGHDGSYVRHSSCYQLTGGAWVPQDSLATARYAAAGSLTSDGEWLVTGGTDDTGRLSSTELLSGGTWQAGPSMVEPVAGHCQVTLGGVVYIIGG